MWRNDDFPYTSTSPARAVGWLRRMSQRSPDHRGSVAVPGRVATLVPSPHGVVHGTVFTISASEAASVLAALRHRERAGYSEARIEVAVDGGSAVTATVFFGAADNEHCAGVEDDAACAVAIAFARGESGENFEYLSALLGAMRSRGIVDEYLEGLFERVAALRHAAGLPMPPPA